MQHTPDALSTFIRFLQLRSSSLRTQQEYVRWVTRLAKHCGVVCASLLSQESIMPGVAWALTTVRTIEVAGVDLHGADQKLSARVCEVGAFLAL